MTVSGTPGTGAITLGSAVAGYQSLAAAGVTNGAVVSYGISDVSTAWEIGQGTYTTSGTSLARTTVLASSNSGAAISVTSAATVYLTAFASDLQSDVAISGGTIDNVSIGVATAATGAFTSLSSTVDASFHGVMVGLGASSVTTNQAIGTDVLAANTTGSYNVGLGVSALAANTTGSYSMALGAGALQGSATGSQNIAIGFESLTSLVTGSFNLGIGASSLVNLGTAVTAGSFVVGNSYTIASVGTTSFTSIGASANTVGVTFTATGAGSGTGTATPNSIGNTAIGVSAGGGIVSGSNNTIIGTALSGFSANLSGAVVIGTGDGVARVDYNYTTAATWTFSAPVTLPSYTVGTLPAAGVPGRMAYASNCRVFSVVAGSLGTLQATSAGTGSLVIDNGTAWQLPGTTQTASA
jgi:hypothetical protein